MLLNRDKSELEISMENALFKVEEIPQVADSFLICQQDISNGRLEGLVSNLNELYGISFKEMFREEDFENAIFMSDRNVLSSYASSVGFYPFACGFIFPHFEPIVGKLLHCPSETRGFYVVKGFFRQPPFSDTGVIFVDRSQLEITFMHYHELTSSSMFQYSKSHQFEEFKAPKDLLLAYELELALVREIISMYVQNKEFAIFQGINLEPVWSRACNSLKEKLKSDYLPNYKRMIEQLGGYIANDLELELKSKIDTACDLMKTLLNRDTREIADIFFRLGTTPNDMRAGKLYSPLNDMLVYFR